MSDINDPAFLRRVHRDLAVRIAIRRAVQTAREFLSVFWMMFTGAGMLVAAFAFWIKVARLVGAL